MTFFANTTVLIMQTSLRTECVTYLLQLNRKFETSFS